MKQFITWGKCSGCGAVTWINSNNRCFLCHKITRIEVVRNHYDNFYYCSRCGAYIKHEDVMSKPGQSLRCSKGHRVRTRTRYRHARRHVIFKERFSVLKKLQKESDEKKKAALLAVETRKNNELRKWVQNHLPELLAGEHIATPEPEELKK